jgi:hypothetical protein
MKVVKKFGYNLITFSGTDKAIDILTRIHKAYSERGYGISLPTVSDGWRLISMPGVGEVRVHRISENSCQIIFVEGRFKSTFRKIFSRE